MQVILAKISCCSDDMIWNEALEKFCFTPLSFLCTLTELYIFFCMNSIAQIPSRGIIVKLQIWLSEIEE